MSAETNAALREITGIKQGPASVKYDLANLRDFNKDEINQETAHLVAEMARTGISKVLEFCLVPQPTKGNEASRRGITRPLDEYGMRIAMRRFVSVAWMLHSEMMVGETGEPLTLDQLGKLPQLDCTKVTLSLIAKQFGEKCNFHARIQKRKGSKENYAGAAKTGWAKRRAREAAAKA